MNSSELRARAREKLKGFWGLALGVALVAALLGAGGGSSSGSFVNLVYRLQNQYGDTENARQIIDQLAPLALMGASVAGLAGMVQFVLGGPVTLGLKTFFLNLDRGKPAKFEDLFSQFQNFLNGFLLQLLTSLFILLWALLLIVPGIIAGFSYAMAPYLMADGGNPGLEGNDEGPQVRALLPGPQLHRVGASVPSDARHRQPVADAVHGGVQRRLLRQSQGRHGADEREPAVPGTGVLIVLPKSKPAAARGRLFCARGGGGLTIRAGCVILISISTRKRVIT